MARSGNQKLKIMYIADIFMHDTDEEHPISRDDENYYMIGYDSEAAIIKHYRVDKMLHIECVEAARDGKKQFDKFDMADYARKTFGMFRGDEKRVHIRCENELAGVMIDRFGKEARIHIIDKEHFEISVTVNVSNQFYGWVTALGPGAVIVSPQEVVAEFRKHLGEVLGNYSEYRKP